MGAAIRSRGPAWATATVLLAALCARCTCLDAGHSDWNLSRVERAAERDAGSTALPGPPPPPVLERPAWQPTVWVLGPSLEISGRCDPSADQVRLEVDGQPRRALASSCAATGRFEDRFVLETERQTLQLSAINRYGESAGLAFEVLRREPSLDQPHLRHAPQQLRLRWCELAIDASDHLLAVCRGEDPYDSLVRPLFGSRDLVGPLARMPLGLAASSTFAATFDEDGAPLVFGAGHNGSDIWLHGLRWLGQAWALLPSADPQRQQTGFGLKHARDDQGRHLVAFQRSAGEVDSWAVRRWDGDAWQDLGDPAPRPDLSSGLLQLAHRGGEVYASLVQDGQLWVRRLDGARWQGVGAAAASGTAENLRNGALLVGDGPSPWQVWRGDDLLWHSSRWDGAAWIEAAAPLAESAVSVQGAQRDGELFLAFGFSEANLQLYRCDSGNAVGWSALRLPGPLAGGAVAFRYADLTVGGRVPALHLGVVADASFRVFRWDGAAWDQGLELSEQRQAIASWAELEICSDGRLLLPFVQGGSLHLDEWRQGAWVEHPEAVAGVGDSDFPYRTPSSVLGPDDRLYVAASDGSTFTLYGWSDQGWQALASLDPERVVLALHAGASGELYAADCTWNGGACTLRISLLQGSRFEALGAPLDVDPAEDKQDPSLAHDAAGRLVVAFAEDAARDLFVERWDGSAWTRLGGDLAVFRMDRPFLFFDQGELLLVKMEAPMVSFAYDPTLLRWQEAAAAWEVVGPDPVNTGSVLQSLDRPYHSAAIAGGQLVIAVKETPAGAAGSEIAVVLYRRQGDAFSARETDLPACNHSWLRGRDQALYWLYRSMGCQPERDTAYGFRVEPVALP